jgi:hypothetical protein
MRKAIAAVTRTNVISLEGKHPPDEPDEKER